MSNGQHYVGQTQDLTIRLTEHNSGKTKSTKGKTPWIVIYTANFPDRTSARKHEKYLKTGAGRQYLIKQGIV